MARRRNRRRICHLLRHANIQKSFEFPGLSGFVFALSNAAPVPAMLSNPANRTSPHGWSDRACLDIDKSRPPAWSGDRRTPESGAAQLLPVRPQRFGLGRLGHRDLRIEVPRALLMMFPGRDIFVTPQRRHPHVRRRDGRHTSIFMGIARLEVLAQPRHQLLKVPMLPERPSLGRHKDHA